MYVAGGLGQIRDLNTAFSVPSISDLSIDDSDLLTVTLEASPLFTDFHATLPVQSVLTRDMAYFANGLNRMKRYNADTATEAYIQAPVRAPTVEAFDSTKTLGAPVDVCLDDDYMYVTDASGHRIIKLTRAGTWIAEFDRNSASLPAGISYKLDEPMGMCQDGTHLFVCDSKNDRVLYFLLSDFSYVGTFGATGTGNGQFDTPFDICHDGTYLYVTDSLNDRISIWTKSTKAWNSHYGSTGTGTDQFDTPKGIACDTTTPCLWICDQMNNRLAITDKAAVMGGAAWTVVVTGSGYSMSLPSGVGLDDSFTSAYVARGAEIQRWTTSGAAAPTFEVKLGSWGTGDEEYTGTPFGVSYDSGQLWVADNHWGFGDDGRLKQISTATLIYLSEIGQTVETDSWGYVAYAYAFVDAEGVESGLSPLAYGQHPADNPDLDVTVFHSMDSKVTLIRYYRSYADATDDLYRLVDETNNAAGTTNLYRDQVADADLGTKEPSTDKRGGSYGLPPIPLVADVWRDMLWTAGAVIAPDYQVGQATFGAAWDTDHGFWKVTGDGTTRWTEDMVGRTILDAAEAYSAIIAFVDETNQYLWLCNEWEGTTGSAIDYIIRDTRNGSEAHFSTSGLHEDVHQDNWVPVGVGDGDQILGLRARNERLFVFKRNSVWVITGTSSADFVVRKVTSGSGISSPSSVVEFPVSQGGSILAFWAFPIIYAIRGGSDEPAPFSTFLDPLLAAVSEGASPRAAALLDYENQHVTFSMAEDDDLVNHKNVTFEYGVKKWAEEPGPRMMATGHLRNKDGTRRPFFLDEFGTLWQSGIGTSDGATANDLTAEITGYDAQSLKVSASAATFDLDLEAVPVFLIQSDGTTERNVIVNSAAHDIYLAWEPSSAPDSTWSLIIAGIEFLLRTGRIDSGILEVNKRFQDLWLGYEAGSATVRLDVAEDDDALSSLIELDWSVESPQSIPLTGSLGSFRGHWFRFQLSTYNPGEPWSLSDWALRFSFASEVR